LTDHKYEILQLLRVHVYDSDATVAVRQVSEADIGATEVHDGTLLVV
jgi:hypothetical protein